MWRRVGKMSVNEENTVCAEIVWEDEESGNGRRRLRVSERRKHVRMN